MKFILIMSVAVIAGLLAALPGLGDSSASDSPEDDLAPEFDRSGDAIKSSGRGFVQLPQGLTDDDFQHFYTDYLGARILPKAWFFALEDVTTGKLLSDKESLKAIGALYEEGRDIPIGLAEGDGPGGKWLGNNCAFCHTTEISYKGTTMRVVGGTGKMALNSFVTKKVLASIMATATDDRRFADFADRLLSKGSPASARDGLRTAINGTTLKVKPYLDSVAQLLPVDDGPGRLASNAKQVQFLAAQLDPRNIHVESGYVTVPAIWKSNEYRWMHFNQNNESRVARNALDWSGFDAFFSPTSTKFAYMPEEMHWSSESFVAKVQPPAWPEHILGTINHPAADRGAKTYSKLCSSCHTPKSDGKYLIANMFDFKDIGTDPAYIDSQYDVDPKSGKRIERQVFTGALAATVFADATGKPRPQVGMYDFFKVMSQRIMDERYKELGKTDPRFLDAAFQSSIQGGRINQTRKTDGYTAKPLLGIWATAPYLHNDSVANLYELFLPAAKRAKKFRIGGDFQPKVVGYDIRGTVGYEFDTHPVGNSNAGHEGPAFGTTLSNSDRLDLIEYLKTL